MTKNIFNKDLKILAEELKNEFHNNKPFPHVVINGLFNDDKLRAAKNDISKINKEKRTFHNHLEIKEMYHGEGLLSNSPDTVKEILNSLNSDEFVSFIEDLSGIDNLIKDDNFIGAGVHHIPPGGKLGIHIDFSRAPWDVNLYRRANVLLYLNEDWKDEWGGHLELWDDSIKNKGKCVKKITPNFNTLVIFGTKKASWHGHPHPLMCPNNKARQSFASYYYSKESSDDNTDHSTIFQ